MSKNITLSVYNTMTGKYENVPVSEEVYRVYKRTGWNIDDNNASFYDHEIQFSQLVGGDDGAYENFHEFISSANDTENAVIDSIRKEKLRKILPSLTKKEQGVINLLYFEGYSALEAGEMLGVSKQAVNKLKRAALNRIKLDKQIF